MPKNRIIYYGTLVLVATVFLWLGAELTKRIEWILPYTAGLSVAMIVGGFVYEWYRSGRLRPPKPDAPTARPLNPAEPRDKPRP
ncbi:MAG: hypothetical protein KJ070_07345 [Verrucomicrobia bacterium]|nr:hypothetical protein [Verrucomicrobiota bacterium]